MESCTTLSSGCDDSLSLSRTVSDADAADATATAPRRGDRMSTHRTTLLRTFLLMLGLGLIGSVVVNGQGGLSNQVLQLLTRSPNTWTGTNYYQDLRVPFAAIPGDTAARIYSDLSGNLYYNGGLIAGAGGVTVPHNLLSTTHPDTVAAAATRGAVIVANATPSWARVQPSGGVPSFLGYNGTDTAFTTDGSAFTVLPAASLTGILPAISGVNLTSLNATNLGSGTVPLARLSGITTSQLAAGAAIVRSQLSLAAGIVLTTDVTGTLPIANGGTGLAAFADNTIPLSNAGALVATAIPNCVSGTTALAYTAASHTISCQALSTGLGSVTSVGLSLPAIFTVTGSPVASSGTLTGTLATETANYVWAGPTSGGAVAPTFRALVNGDLPLTGVSAGTYPKVTVNTAGVVTTAATQITLTTDVTGILPMANGGTGVGVSATNTVLVGNAGGTAWAALTLPDTTTGFLSYSSSTHLFSLGQIIALGTLTSTTPIGLSETWNSGATVFNAVSVAVTDSASNGASTLVTYSVGGNTKYSVRKDGSILLLTHQSLSVGTPSITAGFGSSPSIAGIDAAFRVTQGTPVGATGTVVFGNTYTSAPVCTGVDETTTAGNPLKLTAAVSSVAVASGGTMVAGDLLAIHCTGY